MWDIVIIGGGPAGLTAAIFAARFKLKAIVLAKQLGGLIATAHAIENYPGFLSIAGSSLAQKFERHARQFGVPIAETEVISVKKVKAGFEVQSREKVYRTRTVLFATGTERRKLGVPGEDRFVGKGVSYCAACDGILFRNKIVAVIGGSDAAAKEALLLARWAKKVYIIYRKAKIRAEPATIEAIAKAKKIKIIPNTTVTEIRGKKVVEAVLLSTGRELPLAGIFVEVGGVPISAIAGRLGVALNAQGEIITDKNGCTNVPGIFAAGDVTDRRYKQAITAAADGATATFSAYKYIQEAKTACKK